MSNIFGNLSDEGLEEAQDYLGGFSALDSDLYPATIKVVYAGQSKAGAQNVTFVADINGREYRETIYVTNKKGENFYPNKQDPTKKVPLPGWVTANDICLVATGMSLKDQPAEDKMVNVWDPEARRELPKSVKVLVDLTGKRVDLGIIKTLLNKNERQGDEYVATADTREENSIDKVFDPESKMTVFEAKNGKTEGTFQEAWVAKNKGQTRDKREIKDGEAGRSGRPGASAGAPQAGAASKGKSLFGNKAA